MARSARSSVIAAVLAAGGVALLSRPPRASADGDAQPPVTRDRDKEREKAFDDLQAALDELIDLYEKREPDKDRLWIDARMALHEVTGYDRPTAKLWRALWQEIGKSFDPMNEKGRGKDPAWRLVLPDGSKGEHVVPGE